jgi:hypothetical protein
VTQACKDQKEIPKPEVLEKGNSLLGSCGQCLYRLDTLLDLISHCDVGWLRDQHNRVR